MSLTLDYIAANPDCRLTIWAAIEGLDSILTQADGPTDPGDWAQVQQVLEPAPLSTVQGIDSILTGQPVGCSLTLKICDRAGWLRGLLTDTQVARLYAPVDRDDDEIQITPWAGISAPGVVYLGRERIAFGDYTDDGDHYTLLDCERATYSDGYNGRYPTTPDGVLPVYPVSLTPGRLEGRYIRLFALPLAPDSTPLFGQNDAQEIWRGVIDSVPISIDGVLWEVQCKGLESLLNQQVRNENQGRALLVSPVWEPPAQPLWVIQPGALLRFRVRREVWYQYGVLGDPPTYDVEHYSTVETGWLQVAVPYGITAAGTVSTLLLANLMASAIYNDDPDTWEEFNTGTGERYFDLRRDDQGALVWGVGYLSGEWPLDRGWGTEPAQARYEFWVDFESDLAQRYGVQKQLGLLPHFPGQTILTSDYQQPSEFVWGDVNFVRLCWGGQPVLMHAISERRDRLWVEFPDGPPWTQPGHLRIGDEIVQIVSLSLADWQTQVGGAVYELTVVREQTPKTPWTWEQKTNEEKDPPEFEPVLAVVGQDAFVCAAGLLMGIHEDEGNGPYSQAIGAGIYACHCDLPEFARLLASVPITGGRRAVYDDEIRVQDWLAQNLALEEWAIVPGFVGSEYKLRPVRISTAPARVHAIVPDWQGAIQIQSGLGRVVNVVQVSVDNGRGTYRDLDSAAKYGVTRTQAYELAQVSSTDGLANVGAAAARLFALYGSPTILLTLPLPATGRSIEPGDGIEVQTPNLPTEYTVLSARRAWIGGREHCILVCQEIPQIDSGYYAPVALFAAVDGKTGTVGAGYTEGLNPFSGEASAAEDYFQVGDQVVLFDPDDQMDSAYDTIASIDAANHTITLTTNNPSIGQAITLRTRATATTVSAGRYIWVDGETEWL